MTVKTDWGYFSKAIIYCTSGEINQQARHDSEFNPANAEAELSSKIQGCTDFWKPFEPCHVGIHWIGLAVYSQMSTHVPGFQ